MFVVSPFVGAALVHEAPPLDSLESPPAYALVSALRQDTVAPSAFKRQCVPCHGEKGKGDGPAAVAFNPPPANLTDPERIGKLTDAELREILTKGEKLMPAFGTVLKPAEIDSLIPYLRKLSGGGSSGAGPTSENERVP